MKNIIATVAIAGTAATLALLNMNSAPVHSNFLATPFTEAERAFIDFIATHGRTYATKEEYEFRLSVFEKTYEEVNNHDAKKAGFTKGINKFAD
jgi:hypothetical protein